MADTERTQSVTRNIVRIIYILYLAELLIGPVSGLIGLILAYVYRSDAPEWLASHYRFQIRTFWIGLLYIITAGIVILIGVVSDEPEILVVMSVVFIAMCIFVMIWLIIRCIKGLKYELREEAYPYPDRYFF